MRHDTTTPDTRLADDPMAYNPATVANLVQLTLGGLAPKHQGEILHARVRYFDPVKRRPGLPDDVAALVDSLEDGSTSLVLVNLNQSEPRELIVQGGGLRRAPLRRGRRTNGRTVPVHGPRFRVWLAPGRAAWRTRAHDRHEAIRGSNIADPWT